MHHVTSTINLFLPQTVLIFVDVSLMTRITQTRASLRRAHHSDARITQTRITRDEFNLWLSTLTVPAHGDAVAFPVPGFGVEGPGDIFVFHVGLRADGERAKQFSKANYRIFLMLQELFGNAVHLDFCELRTRTEEQGVHIFAMCRLDLLLLQKLAQVLCQVQVPVDWLVLGDALSVCAHFQDLVCGRDRAFGTTPAGQSRELAGMEKVV